MKIISGPAGWKGLIWLRVLALAVMICSLLVPDAFTARLCFGIGLVWFWIATGVSILARRELKRLTASPQSSADDSHTSGGPRE